MRYQAKPIRDVDGNVTDYESVKMIPHGSPAPRGYHILYGDDKWAYAKAELSDNNWHVIEDPDAKTAEETKETQKQTRRQELRDQIATLDAAINGATTLRQLKDVLRPFLKKLLRHVMND